MNDFQYELITLIVYNVLMNDFQYELITLIVYNVLMNDFQYELDIFWLWLKKMLTELSQLFRLF